MEDLEYEGSIRWLQYTSKGLEWEVVPDPEFDYDIFDNDSVCSDGHLYWISREDDNLDNVVGFSMRYCPRKGKFACFDLPLLVDVVRVRLVEYEGCVGYLSIVASDTNSSNSTLWLFQNVPGFMQQLIRNRLM